LGLRESGLVTLTENDTECCYALQDKVWVRGPGNEPLKRARPAPFAAADYRILADLNKINRVWIW
jgi:hypothetical protein